MMDFQPQGELTRSSPVTFYLRLESLQHTLYSLPADSSFTISVQRSRCNDLANDKKQLLS
jgi:hypothetical protein